MNPPAAPVGPSAAPLDPSAAPVSPPAAPVDPSAAPVDPSAAPVSPPAAPIDLSPAEAHLRASDPVMAGIIHDVGGLAALSERRTGAGGMELDHYGSLVRSIVGQQLSTRAARAIFRRLTDRYGGRTPTPAEVLAEDPDELRAAAGLSRAKTQFLRSLAEHVVAGTLQLEKLDELPDEAVIAELVAVKGIGQWSAQIFLMFHLDRPDVLAVGDLGIRKAVMLRYALPGLPAPAELEAIGEPWRPQRTLACRFLWASLGVTPQ